MKTARITTAVIALCIGGDVLASDWNLHGYDFYARNFYPLMAAGRGYTGIADKGEMSLSLINPAAMTNIVGFQTSGGFVFKTIAEEGWGTGTDENKTFLKQRKQPYYIGFGYSINRIIQFGLTLYENSAYRMIEKHINHNTGIELEGNYELTRTTAAIPISIAISQKLTLGISLDINKHKIEENNQDIFFKRQCFYTSNPKLGCVYQPFKRFSIGITYGPSIKIKRNIYFDVNLSDGSIWRDTIRFDYKPPQITGVGIKWSSKNDQMDLYADYQYQKVQEPFWSLDGYLYRSTLNIGFEVLYKHCFYRAGILSEMNGYFTSAPFRNYFDGRYYFLTGGFTKNIGPVGVTLAIMDSHLLSTGQYQYTQVGVGFAY